MISISVRVPSRDRVFLISRGLTAEGDSSQASTSWTQSFSMLTKPRAILCAPDILDIQLRIDSTISLYAESNRADIGIPVDCNSGDSRVNKDSLIRGKEVDDFDSAQGLELSVSVSRFAILLSNDNRFQDHSIGTYAFPVI